MTTGLSGVSAVARMPLPETDWRLVHFAITPDRSHDSGRLVIKLARPGTVHLSRLLLQAADGDWPANLATADLPPVAIVLRHPLTWKRGCLATLDRDGRSRLPDDACRDPRGKTSGRGNAGGRHARFPRRAAGTLSSRRSLARLAARPRAFLPGPPMSRLGSPTFSR